VFIKVLQKGVGRQRTADHTLCKRCWRASQNSFHARRKQPKSERRAEKALARALQLG
jgi:hypothetical protein